MKILDETVLDKNNFMIQTRIYQSWGKSVRGVVRKTRHVLRVVANHDKCNQL